MRLSIQGKEVETWPPEIWAKWHEVTDQLPRDEGYYVAANYFAPRPWRNEYDIGSKRSGFCYTLNGRRVCIHYMTDASGKKRIDTSG